LFPEWESECQHEAYAEWFPGDVRRVLLLWLPLTPALQVPRSSGGKDAHFRAVLQEKVYVLLSEADFAALSHADEEAPDLLGRLVLSWQLADGSDGFLSPGNMKPGQGLSPKQPLKMPPGAVMSMTFR